MSNEMTIMENNGYMAAAIDLRDLFSEEMEGLRPSFDRIKIPAGGGISYEVPGDDPSNPDSVKEFKAVMPINPTSPASPFPWQQVPQDTSLSGTG